jgi:hypothetical protein
VYGIVGNIFKRMKNPFFNLPDFGGELLDFRLALRLIVRQAFKPMLGHDNHAAPRYTVRGTTRPAFMPALKAMFQKNLRFISQTAWFQQILPVISNFASPRRNENKAVPTKGLTTRTVSAKPIAGKNIGGKPLSTKPAMGKSVYKGAAQRGKRVVAGENTSTSRLVHPVTTQPEKVRDGMWVEYNKHAIVVARGSYANNLKNGLWREYYDTGELMIEEHFVLGVQHGRFATFHPNGQCCSEGKYEQGRREGRFFMYDESGRHVRSLAFKRDVLLEDVIIEQQLAMA